MKKLATLLLAAGMVLGGFAGAQAIDWKAKGEWIFEFGYNSGLNLAQSTSRSNHRDRYGSGANGASRDNFNAVQRVRLQIDAVASESLSGQVFFEIGNQRWGQNSSGGALGTDSIVVEVRRAFIDWIVPTTDIKVRMGLQGMALPSYTFDTGVFNDDVAGITASWKINNNMSLVAFWARPYNDNFSGNVSGSGSGYAPANYMDNVDAFGLVIPLSFDGFKITPWGMFSFIGPDALSSYNRGGFLDTQARTNVVEGLFPAAWRNTGDHGTYRDYRTAWWVGLTGEITAADPFRLAWDANYGSQTANYGSAAQDRSGWFINLLAEYKLDWGVPGLYGWWGSGDDGSIKNGSERLPIFSINNSNLMLSTFGFNGGYFADASDGGTLGHMYAGSWGIGARIRDMSFVEDLKHTLRVNFFGGTNDPEMAKYITGKKAIVGGGQYWNDFNSTTGGAANAGLGGAYLTTLDYGVEVNIDSIYKIYENLDLLVELGYIHVWLDQSRGVWGADPTAGVRGVSVTDAVKASAFFRYSF